MYFGPRHSGATTYQKRADAIKYITIFSSRWAPSDRGRPGKYCVRTFFCRHALMGAFYVPVLNENGVNRTTVTWDFSNYIWQWLTELCYLKSDSVNVMSSHDKSVVPALKKRYQILMFSWIYSFGPLSNIMHLL